MAKLKTKPISSRKFKLYHLLILPYFLIIDTLKNLKEKRYINGLAMLIITIIFSGIWLGGYAITALAGYQIAKQTVFNKTAINSSLPTTTTTPIVTPSTPDIKGTTTTKTQPVYTDSDPVVTCTSSYPNCLGQSIKAKQSVCSNVTCCQIGNKWSIYPSKALCQKDQDKYWKNYYSTTGNNNMSSSTSTYTAPSYPPCTVNYKAGAYTYTTIPPETCKQRQDAANAGSTNTAPQPTSQPTAYSQPPSQSPPQKTPKGEAEKICKGQADSLLGNGDANGRYAAGNQYAFCMGNYGYTVTYPSYPGPQF